MAAFDRDDEMGNDVAYGLVRNGFVTKFRDMSILAGAVDWLAKRDYQVAEIDAGVCSDLITLLDQFALVLDFPDYFGRNLDALNDCLRDVAAGDYGFDLESTGLVLVLRHFDTFACRQTDAAVVVLDIFADQCRGASLFGRRMMCLVQSDDANFDLPPLGGLRPGWNDTEGMRDKRRP